MDDNIHPDAIETSGTIQDSLSPKRNGRRRKRLWIFLAILGVTFCAGDTYSFMHAMKKRKPTLKRWLPFAVELGRDDQLYNRHPDYLYPPFFLVLLKPLTYIPRPFAALIWQFSKYAVIILIFAAAWGIVSKASSFPVWAKLASIIVSARFVLSDLRHGNVNLFICCFIVSAAWFIATNRGFVAGFCVAIATCIKLTPALWAVYLIYKRQWSALAGILIGIVVAIEVVPLLVLTPQMNHALLYRWYDHVVLSFIKEGRISSIGINQSMAAVTNRLLGRNELTPDEEPVVICNLDDNTIKWVQRVLAAILIAALFWSCRGRMPKTSALQFAAEWAMVAPITLALSGYTWTGHFSFLVLSIVTLMAYLASFQQHQMDRASCLLSIAAFSLFLFTTDIITPTGRRWAYGMGLLLLGALLVFAALAVARERLRHSEQSDFARRV